MRIRKNDKKNIAEILDRHLSLFNSPPPEEMERAEQRILHRLQQESLRQAEESTTVAGSARRPWRWGHLAAIGVAAALVLTVFMQMPSLRNLKQEIEVHAVVEAADGGLFRVSGGQALYAGNKIQAGDIVRTDGGIGTVLTLDDGSRIEMRPQSTLSLERANDGVRIRLDNGGIIVAAAKQRMGHLYVQTKDVTVSVAGTVFLVNTEEAGSRVAVIQGEVYVQQGTTAKKLLPGEQVATNPLMESHPVSEQVSWSREAETHVAMLEQSAASQARQGSPVPKKLEFEVASIREIQRAQFVERSFVECRGIDGVWSYAREVRGFNPGSGESPAPVPQGRCIGSGSVRTFIAAAYGVPVNLVSGEETAWFYRLEAKAENTADVTAEQLRSMLQNLVIDRFKIKAHRYTEERAGYFLVVAKSGPKFKETSGDEELPRVRAIGTFVPGAGPGQLLPLLLQGKFGLRRFAEFLTGPNDGKPVIDQTGLSGVYDISLTLHQILRPSGRGGGNTLDDMFDPPLAKALEDQLGLRLEAAGKVPVEHVSVDYIERPTEN